MSSLKCFTRINLLLIIKQPCKGSTLSRWVGNSGTEKLSHLSKVTQLLVALGFEPRSSAPRELSVIVLFTEPWGQLSLLASVSELRDECT